MVAARKQWGFMQPAFAPGTFGLNMACIAQDKDGVKIGMTTTPMQATAKARKKSSLLVKKK